MPWDNDEMFKSMNFHFFSLKKNVRSLTQDCVGQRSRKKRVFLWLQKLCPLVVPKDPGVPTPGNTGDSSLLFSVVLFCNCFLNAVTMKYNGSLEGKLTLNLSESRQYS